MDRFGRKVQWDVKRSVYVASAFYLFYYGGKACLFPFLTLYFRQIGLSASQTGLALGVKAFLWFCVSPIWMSILQRLRKTRIILCYSIFIVIGSNLALTLLPPSNSQNPLYVCLNESSAFHGGLQSLSGQNNLISTFFLVKKNSSMTPTFTLPMLSTTPASIRMELVSTKRVPGTSPSSISSVRETAAVTAETTRPASVATTLTTTTESVPPTSTEMSVFQVAKRLVSLLQRHDVTSDDKDLIQDFIDEENDTKDWPRWKKRVIIRQIINLLLKDEEHNPEPRRPSGFSFRRHGRQRRGSIGVKRKRSAENNKTESNYLFDTIKNINFTSISEKKDDAIKHLKNFAQEIKPYMSSNMNLFGCVLIILVVGELLSAPVELVSDNSLYNLLDELDSLNQYGRHRIFALVGAAMCGISVSIIIYFSPCFINGSINRFHIHFYLFALLLGISFILASIYPSYDPVSTRARISSGSQVKSSTCSLMICSSCRHFLLFITIFIIGITQAPMQNFMLWMIQDMEGASELVYGSFVSANAICAMISSLFGRKIIKLLKPCSAALISLMSIAIQLLFYAFMPNPWIVVPLQLLNVTGLSFLWTIVSHHTSTTMSSAYENSEKISSVHMFARASQQRTLHTTYVSVYQGLAFSFGSVLSGFIYDYMKGDLTTLLIGSAVLVAVWGLVFAMYQCCCLPRKLMRKYSHLVSDSESDANQAENQEFKRKYTTDYGEKNGNYYNVKSARRKKRQKRSRLPIDTNSSSSDSDEHDWLRATMKKESRML